MTINKLNWQALQPDSSCYQSIFSNLLLKENNSIALVQPRLIYALEKLYKIKNFPLLLICSQENNDYLSWIATAAKKIQNKKIELFGGNYQVIDNTVKLMPPSNLKHSFTSNGGVYYCNWIDEEQIFGCVRQYKSSFKLEPGLIHHANGGTLILSLSMFLSKPLLWLRLRRCLEQNSFDWYAKDKYQTLPIFIPPLPLKIRIILCGNRNALSNFQQMDSETYTRSLYSEFEEELNILSNDDLIAWCQWTLAQVKIANLPQPNMDFWPLLINEAVRMTEHKKVLPLCPIWLRMRLEDSATYGDINASSLEKSIEKKLWLESYFDDSIRDDILLNNITIQTKGDIVGQINSLSIIEIPGHPRAWGEPLRITCIVHFGDGEVSDIEHKVELSGNLHTKGMMIIRAYLISQLKLEQSFPFSASLVFEQSYAEIDGDSASLAELCVLISSLSNKPITQQIAVTGSVDQLGNVQPVSGLNEKIESFFCICNARHLTGQQGVILPANNIDHLSLNNNVVKAVKEGKFHIWAIESVDEALLLLTGISWQNKNEKSLLSIILERINQLNNQEKRKSSGFLKTCFNLFHKN